MKDIFTENVGGVRSSCFKANFHDEINSLYTYSIKENKLNEVNFFNNYAIAI